MREIWIIDDDAILTFSVRFLLQRDGHFDRIESYGHGKEALDQLLERNAEGSPMPHTILLDINMPVMNGWEFLDSFKEHPAFEQIRVFIFSSSSAISDKKKSEEYVIQGYIVKPLSHENILLLKQG